MYCSRLITFMRDVTMVWWAGLNSLIFTEVFNKVLRVNYRYFFWGPFTCY